MERSPVGYGTVLGCSHCPNSHPTFLSGEISTAAELLRTLGKAPVVQRGSRKTRLIPEGRKIQGIPNSGGTSPSSALADHSACFALVLFSAGPQGWVHPRVTLWLVPVVVSG